MRSGGRAPERTLVGGLRVYARALMPRVVVASLNLHAGVDGWGRRFDASSQFEALRADVVVLQETWSPDDRASLACELGSRLGYTVVEVPLARGHVFGPPSRPVSGWGPVPRSSRIAPSLRLKGDRNLRGAAARWPADRPAEAGTWGIAIASRLPVLRSETVELGKLSRDPAPRAGLLMEVDLVGVPLVVVGTHLSHLTHGSPSQLLRLRRSLPRPPTAGVLAGDMNLWGPPVSALLPGWRRAVVGRTWPAGHPVAQLDHVLVNRVVTVVAGEVLGPGGSDHRAVRATLVAS